MKPAVIAMTKAELQALEYTVPYHWLTMQHNCLARYVELSAVMARMLRQHARPGPGLDIGCGDGRSTFEVACLLGRDYKLSGIDYDARAIHFARLFAPEIEFRVTNGDGLGAAAASMTFLCCREVLEHIAPDAVPAFIAEQYRVLVPGGIAVVVVPSTRLPVSAKHYRHFTAPSLAQCYGQFESVELIGFGDRPKGNLGEKLYTLIDLCPGLWKVYQNCWRTTGADVGDLVVGCFRKPVTSTIGVA